MNISFISGSLTPQQTFVALQDVFKTCLEDVFNTSSAKQFFVFQDVLKDQKLLG